MAQCKECNRHAMAFSEYCFFHNPDVSDEEKQQARSKGGRSSRRVEALNIDDVKPVEDVVDLKQFLNSLLGWLIAGKVTPSQARALVSVGGALRDCLELELVEILSNRLALVEGGQPKMLSGGEQWRVENSDTLSDN